MKQNTKFIWIYGAILFSFALILIVFAGLTQKESAHEEEKLSQSLSSLGRENSDLVTQRDNLQITVNDLQAQLNTAVQEKENEAAEKNSALLAYGGDIEVTKVLIKAYSEKASGSAAQAKETVSALDAGNMTDAQRYVYNTIIGG